MSALGLTPAETELASAIAQEMVRRMGEYSGEAILAIDAVRELGWRQPLRFEDGDEA